MANKGPLYGLSKDCRIKALKKFDIKQVRDVLHWMEAVLGRQIHHDIESLWSERDVAVVLKDGVALCELMNAIKPGAVKRINRGREVFKQMENLELFTKACIDYGLQPLDVFQITDLFEVKAVYTVFQCLHSLGSLAQKNGYTGPKYGVAISEKKERHFSTEQIAQGKMIIPKQAGSNVVPSQAGMTPYGFSRQIVPSDNEVSFVSPISSGVINLQYGTNSTASQRGMTPYGLGRQITLSSVSDEPVFPENPTPEQQESPTPEQEQSPVGQHSQASLSGENSDEKDGDDHAVNENESPISNNEEKDDIESENENAGSNETINKIIDIVIDDKTTLGVESSVDGDSCSKDINGGVAEQCTANGHAHVEVNGDDLDLNITQVNGS